MRQLKIGYLSTSCLVPSRLTPVLIGTPLKVTCIGAPGYESQFLAIITTSTTSTSGLLTTISRVFWAVTLHNWFSLLLAGIECDLSVEE
ncbi:hypothetical protein RSOLAG1IB_10948 [Rhizoctonia solani AG-1 IB]|uniref:Uncharacterized protein n=1 Tax=Thanatephorus cucumeris (strain AG1-IB / isolate 7/3/14) TaxID=1108050 RepID=A0A0B7G1W7_THACB|nr:hypothetical protein RSOLAG1IB_10948 [Rhizoctonia solani AG-1 IB]